jgi:hypothetical protein
MLDDIESRVRTLEEDMMELREQVSELTSSVLGDLRGKKGLISLVEQGNELSKRNSEQLDAQTLQLESLRLDRAKIIGIIAAVSAILGLLYKLFLK